MKALRVGADPRPDVIWEQRVVLLRDLVFQPPDLRIGAADRYLNQLVSVDDTAKQSLELARNSRPVLRCLDVFSPSGRQTPGAHRAAVSQLERQTMPLEQEIARVVANRRRRPSFSRLFLRELPGLGDIALDGGPPLRLGHDDGVRCQANRCGKRRIHERELRAHRS